MWRKAIWKGHPMRLELTRVGLLVELANYCTTRGASQPFSVARHVGRFKWGSELAQLYVRLSIIPISPLVNYVSSGIIRYYVVTFVCLHFALSEIRVLNSLDELCITRLTAVNSFARVLNPQGRERIYCHPQTDSFVVSQLFYILYF